MSSVGEERSMAETSWLAVPNLADERSALAWSARMLVTSIEDTCPPNESNVAIVLIIYICFGIVWIFYLIGKCIVSKKARQAPAAAKKYEKETESQMLTSNKLSASTKVKRGGSEVQDQATNMAIKRILFQKMNKGYVDDDDEEDEDNLAKAKQLRKSKKNRKQKKPRLAKNSKGSTHSSSHNGDDDDDDDEGYIEEGNVNSRKRVDPGREPWETDVKKIKFDKRIGAGNFGEVWTGTWMHSKVAIKTVIRGMADNKVFVGKFVEEIRLMSELQHPNIVMFLGACIQPPHICLILEYCVHGNLVEFLQSAREQDINITMHLILKIALDIARGIKYLHDKMKIIQRDIKGRNVLIDENLNGKISDFGLSRIKNEDDAGLTACGTPAWTAPEVVRMEEYTEKVDVYSFAVVLWELITQSEPYEGEGGIQVAYAAAEQGLRPPIPKYTPPRYSRLMQECWADSPHDRPHFSDILERLFQMMKDESNPFKAAEFYFGTKPQNYDPTEIERLLDDNELFAGLFHEDYSAIVEERKELRRQELERSNSLKNKSADSAVVLPASNKATIMGSLMPLHLKKPSTVELEIEHIDNSEEFVTPAKSDIKLIDADVVEAPSLDRTEEKDPIDTTDTTEEGKS
ncbi:Protein kinase, putative [Hondaea fermentalgiana]|uniref:Protein kinase, putative n=1 Tax=Hondaea fermentalgiana TaxID=2315210 RepID=A0A2R5GWP5_9STRA|nr:Protein kinase, putative [Hondaea fermentalgiana]|eukprot:GBG32831.1 Protein kinase, putative [Hondaea fermentalgiana]